MTEQPLPTDVTVYAVMFVSADRRGIGGGVRLFWSRDQAVECLRNEIKSQIENRWDDANYDTQAEADAAFAQEMEGTWTRTRCGRRTRKTPGTTGCRTSGSNNTR